MAGVWTEDRVELLKRLHADNFSCSQIAGQLGAGISRNAVIGKLSRMGLVSKRGPRSGSRSNFKHIPPLYKRTFVSIAGIGRKRDGVGRPIGWVEPVADTDIPISQRKSLLELTAATCRWPCGDPQSPDFFFCGGPVANESSYCAHHHFRSITNLEDLGYGKETSQVEEKRPSEGGEGPQQAAG